MTGQKDSSIRRNLNRIDDTAIAALWEAKPFLLEAQTMQAATVQTSGRAEALERASKEALTDRLVRDIQACSERRLHHRQNRVAA